MKNVTYVLDVFVDRLTNNILAIDKKNLKCIRAISYFTNAFGDYMDRYDLTNLSVNVSSMAEMYEEKSEVIVNVEDVD